MALSMSLETLLTFDIREGAFVLVLLLKMASAIDQLIWCAEIFCYSNWQTSFRSIVFDLDKLAQELAGLVGAESDLAPSARAASAMPLPCAAISIALETLKEAQRLI